MAKINHERGAVSGSTGSLPSMHWAIGLTITNQTQVRTTPDSEVLKEVSDLVSCRFPREDRGRLFLDLHVGLEHGDAAGLSINRPVHLIAVCLLRCPPKEVVGKAAINVSEVT